MSDLISKKNLLRWLRDYQFENYAEVGHEKEYNFIENLIEGIENEPAVELPICDWIPCSERPPKNETEVEITCIRRHIGAGNKKKVSLFTARAFYTNGTMTTEDSNFVWYDTDNWAYDEKKDAYIIPEGWWEYVTFSEEFGAIDAEVIAWRPLQEPFDMWKTAN